MKIFYSLLLLFPFFGASHFTLQAQNFDINSLKKINVNRNINLDKSMQFISNTEGYIGVAIPVSFCAVALMQKDIILLEKGVEMAISLAVASAGTYALKRIINRPRPSATYSFIDAFENEKHYSFPSGHTSNAFVTATSLSLNIKKWYIVIPSYTWACAVGYSRMHLGMHYPSDVFAGALLGAGSALITYKANCWLGKYYLKRKEIKNNL